MIKNRKFQHLGFAAKNLEASAKWYVETLGFEVICETTTPDGKIPVKFLKNGDIVYEMYENPDLDEELGKKIDHFCYDSEDIEADYEYCKKEGYKITTDGIQAIETFFERGVRFFKIEGPGGEEVEFCQIL